MNLKKILLIARYTFVEVYKSRVMVNVLLLGAGIALLSYVAAEFTYGVPGRVALDVGVGLTSLSTVAVAIFIGATLISKEVEQRTIYMTLSRPVSRISFIIGRVLGMSSILLLNLLVLTLVTYGCAKMFSMEISSLFYWVTFFNLLEALTMLVIVLLFSLYLNTILTVIFSLSLYISAYVVGETLALRTIESRPVFYNILSSLDLVLPSFSKQNLKPHLLYEKVIELPSLWSLTFSGMLYFFCICLLLVFSFEKKSLD